ncbi:hypothetical protein CHS0354_015558, partial [Potamilus streckersoni]
AAVDSVLKMAVIYVGEYGKTRDPYSYLRQYLTKTLRHEYNNTIGTFDGTNENVDEIHMRDSYLL